MIRSVSHDQRPRPRDWFPLIRQPIVMQNEQPIDVLNREQDCRDLLRAFRGRERKRRERVRAVTFIFSREMQANM